MEEEEGVEEELIHLQVVAEEEEEEEGEAVEELNRPQVLEILVLLQVVGEEGAVEEWVHLLVVFQGNLIHFQEEVGELVLSVVIEENLFRPLEALFRPLEAGEELILLQGIEKNRGHLVGVHHLQEIW